MTPATRKRIWGWFFFDWASQPYHTLLVTFTFGPYFASVALQHYLGSGLDPETAKASAQALWSWALTASGLAIGLGAPILGALADVTGRRIPWIYGFSILYIIGSALLWYTLPDGSNMQFALIAFAVGFIGAEYALIFTNAQLPSLGTSDEIGKISGSGFAFGYLGGLLSLAIMLAFFMEQANGKTLIGFDPLFGLDAAQREGTRFVGPFVAIWFAIFMIPYFKNVRDTGAKNEGTFAQAIAKLRGDLVRLPSKKSLFAYLGSSMFYRDALNGLYGFGGTYAALVLDWSIVQIGTFGIISVIGAAVLSWLGGMADKQFGPKPVIRGSIYVLIGVCVTIVFMSREAIFGIPLAEGSKVPDIVFMVCGVFIGGMGGILQSASRSLMVRHTTEGNSTEAFGLYGLSGRATAFMAPFLIGLVTTLSGSARIGVSPLIGLFIIGLVLLRWVHPKGEH